MGLLDDIKDDDPVVICMRVDEAMTIAPGSKVFKCFGCGHDVYSTAKTIMAIPDPGKAKMICMECFGSIAHKVNGPDQLQGASDGQLDEICAATGLDREQARELTKIAIGKINDFVKQTKRDRFQN